MLAEDRRAPPAAAAALPSVRCRLSSAALAAAVLVAAAACKTESPAQSTPRPQPVAAGTPTAAPVTHVLGGGAEQFSVSTADGLLVVSVPAGTVTAGTTLTAQPITNSALGGVGQAFRLGPDGTRFPRPVTLTFVVTGATTAPVEALAVAFQDEHGYWVHAPDVTRNAAARTVSVTTTHFSDWTLVSADPTQDMAGSFTITSKLDVPAFIDTQTFTAHGTASLTFTGASTTPGVLDRTYVFKPSLTLQPLTSAGVACTFVDPATYSETNAAEAANNPNRFLWGTGAFWHVACGAQTALLDSLFDTEGVSRLGCARAYTGTPTVTADELKGGYTIDCTAQARGTISATWDFLRCGGACTSTNPCHTAAYACASGVATCTDNGNQANGTSCGTNLVCNAGACVSCTAGVACPYTANPCHNGVTSCSTGSSVCVDAGTNVANGTSCGTNQVCNAGVCSACTAGLACPYTANPCHNGVTSCSTGTSVCVDAGTNVANGTSCGTNQVCNAGTCVACLAGLACTPANPCHNGLTSCTSGTSVCVDQNTNVPDLTSCGTPTAPAACTAGTCNACAPSTACQPANPCHNGTTCFGPTCTDLGTNVANGSTCGTNQVCNAGACVACTAGVACTPANPCHNGLTSCSTGTSVCVDQNTSLANGTSCGTNLVCSAGSCVACTAGAACTLQDACVATASIVCTTGSPVCTAQTNVADGTSNTACAAPANACSSGSCLPTPCVSGGACVPTNPCYTGTVACGTPPSCTQSTTAMPDGSACGTNLVCGGGACLACPGANGFACTSTNPCAATASVSCSSGVPVCTDSTFKPDGTVCGTGLTCLAGVCR